MHFVKDKLKISVTTEGIPTEVDNIFRWPLILQKIFGYQIVDPNYSFRKTIFHHLFYLLILTYVTLGTIQIMRTTNDLELIAEASYVLIMTGIYPIKILLFINNRLIFRDLYIAMKTTLLDTINKGTDSEKVLAKARRIVKTIFFMVNVGVVNHELIALVNYLKGTPASLLRTTDTLVPLTFPYIEVSLILQSIYLLEIGGSTAILDMWFIIFIFFVCAASDNLQNVLKVEGRRYGETEVSYAERLNEHLMTFYKGHVEQMKFLKLMNEMYKWLAFIPICNAAMCTCAMLLLLSKEINYNFAPHFVPMLAEIFAYNYFGEMVKTAATGTNEAILEFDWTSLSLKDRKSYYIIITYMNKEFGVRTGLGNDLSLITMTSVLQVTYRAFTMLQSVAVSD